MAVGTPSFAKILTVKKNDMSGEGRSRILNWPLITIGGIVLFTVFYLLAAHYYPGGSNADLHELGFSWRNNYWCELLGENAKNGEANAGRIFGLLGMIILSISISIFWWHWAFQGEIPRHSPSIYNFSVTVLNSGGCVHVTMPSCLEHISRSHQVVLRPNL